MKIRFRDLKEIGFVEGFAFLLSLWLEVIRVLEGARTLVYLVIDGSEQKPRTGFGVRVWLSIGWPGKRGFGGPWISFAFKGAGPYMA